MIKPKPLPSLNHFTQPDFSAPPSFFERFQDRFTESKNPNSPWLARAAVRDRVHCLDLGADDYVVKPVQGRVLDARIRAVLRRGERESSDSATFGDVVIDRSAMTVGSCCRLRLAQD